MTNEEKHALIESALMGRTWTKYPYVVINGRRCEIETWLNWGTPEYTGSGTWAGQKPPNYSINIDLCEAAASRLHEDERGIYVACLYDEVGVEPAYEHNSDVQFHVVNASPVARVNALVKVIQDRK